MPTSPWRAIDATRPASFRAPELLRIWDDYLSSGLLSQARLPIAESWRRSQLAGIDPTRARAPTTFEDRRAVRERWEDHPLEVAAPVIRRWLGPVAGDSEHLIVVSSAQGLLLWLDGDGRVRSAASDSMNFVEGALWSEAGAGTNAIGMALAIDHPVQVHAAEHFSEMVHGWTCAAAPVHNPEDGRLLGVIDLTGPMAMVDPRSLAAVVATARAVEADLRGRVQQRDARLRIRYLDRMTSAGDRLALVSRSGRVIADHPDGVLPAGRVDVPTGGGEVMLPGGEPGFAEPLDGGEAYVVRALRPHRNARARFRRNLTSVLEEEPVADSGDVTGWRRAQLEFSRLAEEQAALRHVATMVAGRSTAEEIFATVAEEVARLLRADQGTVGRYEPDGTMTVTAFWASGDRTLPVGTRIELDGPSVAALVQESGRPSRIDDYGRLSGTVIELARTLGAGRRSTVGAPILVEGRVWGAILASLLGPAPLAEETESRLMGFAELVATAISNAVARAELHASRARIVAAADQTRRRIERDLHDGAQQRLASLALQLRAAAGRVTAGRDDLRDELVRAEKAVTVALDELREISRGIHPAILSRGGLGPALRALSRRSVTPVELEVSISGRHPERIEVAAYYVVSELLTNAVKHARASVLHVAVEEVTGTLHLSIRDDGIGGADPARGSGLVGLRDRCEALGGTIAVESPVGAGTEVLVCLPLEGDAAAPEHGAGGGG
ncbi:MAG: two-component sensor histidine kinase [Blastococcus sp.]|jgi:signal transduction histidine kinase|nr:two-component sensor histidine kinase [Blastococcus sp.]